MWAGRPRPLPPQGGPTIARQFTGGSGHANGNRVLEGRLNAHHVASRAAASGSLLPKSWAFFAKDLPNQVSKNSRSSARCSPRSSRSQMMHLTSSKLCHFGSKRKRLPRFLSTAFIYAGNDLEALRRRERAFFARGSLLPKS